MVNPDKSEKKPNRYWRLENQCNFMLYTVLD